MRRHNPTLLAVLFTTLHRAAQSLPQQAPRARKFISLPDGAEDALLREPPWPGPASSAFPMTSLLTPSLPPQVNLSVGVTVSAGKQSLRSPGASVKQVLYRPTVIFCEHSRYKGRCKEVAARDSSSCYETPIEVQKIVSSVKLVNIMGSCRFYRDLFCQGPFFETTESVAKIWEDFYPFHNKIRSVNCKFPLPIFYSNVKFLGHQAAIDIDSPGECGNDQGCQGDFIDVFEDIANLKTLDIDLNDNVSSIQCPPPSPSELTTPRPDPIQLMSPQYTPSRPLPPQPMPPQSNPPHSRSSKLKVSNLKVTPFNYWPEEGKALRFTPPTVISSKAIAQQPVPERPAPPDLSAVFDWVTAGLVDGC
ncbi:hypothetical protein CP533_5294 [Ophiocordyceps camponoti-saundersi (nom. inval.)]|nr:hypothetical protein CP533_5294 [Ophiocordyceps camponoti-saundersi (nom. inval.)]